MLLSLPVRVAQENFPVDCAQCSLWEGFLLSAKLMAETKHKHGCRSAFILTPGGESEQELGNIQSVRGIIIHRDAGVNILGSQSGG